MKQYLMGVLALAGISVTFPACTDLEPTLYSNLTTGNAYSTESDIDAALVGLYADLNPFPGDAWKYYAGHFIMLTDYATDMGYSTAAGDPTKMSNMTYDPNNMYFSSNWQCMYQVISNANVLLQNIDNISMDETKKKQVIAQAKFLRALSYRDLTDAWGPVPLITELLDPATAKDYPLTSVEEINNFMIADLKECIENLPEEWAGQDLARATKGAAATLLGKIYLRRSENNKFNKEFIFCILHESGTNGGEITNHFGPSDHPEVTNRWQYYAVSLPFWRKYNDADPRKQFFYYNYTGGDKRDDKSEYGFYYKMPDVGETVPPNDTTKLLVNVATMKYSYDMVSEAYYDGRTLSIFRLSDVILCKAEIENNLNGPAAALPYLNEIRARAGAPEYGSSAEFPTPGSKEDMNQAILDERGFELVFEYQRRADLIRFGKYDEVMNAYLKTLDMPSPPVISEKYHYFPYPLNDAQLNSFMEAENPSRIPQ